MQIEAFGQVLDLVNNEKVTRATDGSQGHGGVLVGGVGRDADPEAIVTEYDRLGGLIRLDGDTVKMGTFYNFTDRKPNKKPKIMLTFDINGKKVEVDASKPLPMIVQAAKKAAQDEEEGDGDADDDEDDDDEEEAPKNNSAIIMTAAQKRAKAAADKKAAKEAAEKEKEAAGAPDDDEDEDEDDSE